MNKRYRIQCADGWTLLHYVDTLEEAGQAYLSLPGACDIYDTAEKRFIHPEVEIDGVAKAWEDWWWSQRVWWARLLHKLGLNNPRYVNWTVNTKSGREPRWRYVLRIFGIVGV